MSLKSYICVDESNEHIYHKYVDDEGNRHQVIAEFNPCLYLESSHPTQETMVSHLEKKPLFKKVFNNVKDYRRYTYNNNNDLYGNVDSSYQFIAKNYPETVDFDLNDLRFVYLDIENDYDLGVDIDYKNAEKYAITLITIYDSLMGRYLIFGWKPFNKDLGDDVVYIQCDNELHMLEEFIRFWKSNHYPDVVIGWNSMYYDIPYICCRLETVAPHLLDQLSPIGKIRKGTKKITFTNKSHKMLDVYHIHGVNHIDFQEFYKKFVTDPRIDYKLDTIAYEEVGHKKLDYSDVGNGSLKDLYNLDYDRFVEYGFIDVKLMLQINEKIRVIDVAIEMAYFCKINFSDVISPIRSWDTLIYNYLLKYDLAVEPKKKHEKGEYEGGYVLEPVTGLYNWILSADVNSMYPNAIRWLNIGNETIRYYPAENHSTSPIEGVFFDKTQQSALSLMVTDLYDRRVAAKNKMEEIQNEISEIKSVLKERYEAQIAHTK